MCQSHGLSSHSCQASGLSSYEVAKVVNERQGITSASSEANVAVWANQDQCIISDAIGAVDVPIMISQGVIVDVGHVVRASNRVHSKVCEVVVGKLRYRQIAEDEQREVRAPKEIEESDLLSAFRIDAGCIWRTVSSTYASCVIQITGQQAALIGDT